MTPSRLHQLSAAGQSVWLDYIDRTMLRNGELARRIRDDALTGMTSNPTIFEKALAEGTAYDEQLAAAPAGATAWELFELVETDDVRAACDIFAAVYERTRGNDGYVSIEVSPGVADDADATVAEGRRLWQVVDRPNVMIKVPGTAEGAKAVRRLIADGINVNVTLLFSIDAHRRVIEAYQGGLEDRAQAGQPVDRVASVASFFVSRVDSEVEKRLDALAAASPAERDHFAAFKGKAAVANAKLAYQLFRESFAGARWERLRERGARLQRPLWASTSTKNPSYRDVIYVEELIGPDTVNTIPLATLKAFADHGEVRRTVDMDLDRARADWATLQELGVDMDDVTAKLQEEGVEKFAKSFHQMIQAVGEKLARVAQGT